MKAATVKNLKDELSTRSHKELLEICLQLSKFKKENKELLTYLLFEAPDEAAYIAGVKEEVSQLFTEVNRKSGYLIKKSVRKILREVKKYIRYSSRKETEVELLVFFCMELKRMRPSIKRSLQLMNLYQRQLELVKKVLGTLHEDFQFDYESELEELSQF